MPKFISTICTGHSQPYEHCFVEIGCKLVIIKRNLKGWGFLLTYQVYNNSWSSFNTTHTHSTPFPFQSQVSILGSINHHLHTITLPQSYHRSINRPTPSRHCLKARSPWLRPNTHSQGRKGLISLSSLRETQERSIADESAYVSIDQPYTPQRFYITT